MALVYIIHHRVDTLFAKRIADELAFMYEFYSPAWEDRKQNETALQNAQAVIVVLSSSLVNDDTLRARITQMDSAGKPILVVVRELPKLANALRKYEWIDFTRGDDYTQLANTLQTLLGTSVFPVEEPTREIKDLDDDFFNRDESKPATSESTIPPPAPIPHISPRPPKPITPPALEDALSEPVEFAVYHAREMMPQTWQPLYAYTHRLSARGDIEKDIRALLGEKLNDFRQVIESASTAIPEGGMITASVTLEGVQVNPPSLTLGFYDRWQRFDFKIRATTAPLNQAVNGQLTFTYEGIIIADVPISVFVTTKPDSVAQSVEKHVKLYPAIFCSYSHRDTKIIERVEKAYKALGLTFLRDVHDLRSGQDWNAELLNMIDRADIFQLFWSSTAAQSKYVQQEWEHALNKTLVKRGIGFIRPVYWEEPMPEVPDALGHLHFAFQPELDDDLPPDE